MESYRAAVGPEDKYDIIGGLQFKVLFDLGLREYHKLCDVGCGSLRGGRLFIPYLLKGNYYGIEPQSGLVDDAIENELGKDILRVKSPSIYYNDKFDISKFRIKFDFILAQSIFSHTGINQTYLLLSEARKNIADDGLFVATYFIGPDNPSNYDGNEWRRDPIVTYNQGWFRQACNTYGFSYKRLDISHPSGQTWILLEAI